MLNESKLQKNIKILNSFNYLSKYKETLESVDLLLNINDDDHDYFLCPQEANPQLPNVFLRKTKLLECDQFLKSKSNKHLGLYFEENFQNILDFLNSVELEEPVFTENKKKIELDPSLLRDLVKINIC